MAHIQVFNHHIKVPFLVLTLIEFVLLAVCAYLGISMAGQYNGSGWPPIGLEGPLLTYIAIYAAIMLLATHAMGVYGEYLKEGFGSTLVRTVVSFCLLGASAIIALSTMSPYLSVPSGSLFLAVILSILCTMLVRKIFFSAVRSSSLKRRILVLGAGKRAKSLSKRLDEEQLLGSEVIGYIPSDGNAPLVDNVLPYNNEQSIKDLVDKYDIDEILIAIDDRRRKSGTYFPLDDLLHCKLTGTHIIEMVEFIEREYSQIELAEINTSWMLFRDQFRHKYVRDKCKRVFDIVVCLMLLLLIWPLMVLTAIAVFLESGAPIFYTQKRVGYRGRIFKIYKFRSMTQNAEKDGKAVWAKQNDSRVTKVGAFIRNTRLDELPQIFNILKGEMSFIGPRPERPEFVSDLSEKLPYYDVRHYVKPGLMGWAQLKYSYGASVDDAANKLVYDLYYVKNHSILIDLLIVVQTIEVVMLGKGVH